ncbi:MAG TPA: hypothetical protein VFN42_10775 [Acetobacteraceae bacterium]|nr:hypothetical protein [Acetobacteraceae bacterium]
MTRCRGGATPVQALGAPLERFTKKSGHRVGKERMKLVRASGLFGALLLLVTTAMPIGRAYASPVYNGGPILTGVPNVYYIWYGDNWSSDTATTILPNLITNLSGTPYMNIATSFSTGSYTVGNKVNFGGSVFVNSSSNSGIYTTNTTSLDGVQLDTGNRTIFGIVQQVLAANSTWAADPNGIFDVLTAPGITVSGFGAGGFCGWHYSGSVATGTLNWGGSHLATQYGFIGDPLQGGGCNVSLQNSPTANGNFGADAMASVIAHELFETITDPTGRAWFDSVNGSSTNGLEGADMCAWNFGTVSNSGGANYNVTMNGTNYLLQQQWLNEGGGTGTTGGVCTMSLAMSTPVPEPASFLVLLPGLLGLAGLRWRRAGWSSPSDGGNRPHGSCRTATPHRPAYVV